MVASAGLILKLLLLAALTICTVWTQRPGLVRGLLPRYTLSPSTNFTGCSFTGTRPISVQWYYQGARLPSEPSGGPYFTSEGVLVLRDAGPEDSGNYTCTGSNSLGTTSASTTITIEQEASQFVGWSWFMLFVYAVLVWLAGSGLIASWFCYHHWKAEHHKPPPVDRNECFAIDHEGVMVPEQRPRSRVSGDYTLFGGGYPNPAYTESSATSNEIVDYNTSDGTVTKTVVTTEKEYYYIPPSLERRGPGATEMRGAGAAERRSSRRDSGPDPKLKLVVQEETIID